MPIDSHLPQADPFSLVPTFKQKFFLLQKDKFKFLHCTVSGSEVLPRAVDLDPDPHSFWLAGFGSRKAKISHKSEEISCSEVLGLLF
jgi:hypothetical protein